MNIIVQLEFELAYYDSAAHCFNHYLSGATTTDQRAIAMKEYSTFPKLQHYWRLTRLFSVTTRTLIEGVLILNRDGVSIFCSPSQLGQKPTRKFRIFLVHTHTHTHTHTHVCEELLHNWFSKVFYKVQKGIF